MFLISDFYSMDEESGRHLAQLHRHSDIVACHVVDPLELAAAHKGLQHRHNEELMLSGVTLVSPETVAIQKGVTIEPDTRIGPNVIITGRTRIGKGCRIEANVVIRDSLLGDQVIIGPFSYLENCRIDTDQKLPPYSVKIPD